MLSETKRGTPEERQLGAPAEPNDLDPDHPFDGLDEIVAQTDSDDE